jgi:hypothetical protein
LRLNLGESYKPLYTAQESRNENPGIVDMPKSFIWSTKLLGEIKATVTTRVPIVMVANRMEVQAFRRRPDSYMRRNSPVKRYCQASMRIFARVRCFCWHDFASL